MATTDSYHHEEEANFSLTMSLFVLRRRNSDNAGPERTLSDDGATPLLLQAVSSIYYPVFIIILFVFYGQYNLFI